ncbi:MAG: DUF547 domain-containing protein [bacterium]
MGRPNRKGGARGSAWAAAALLLLLAPAAAGAAPKAVLWKRWLAHDPVSVLRVDHSPWAAFLSKFLTKGPEGINLLAYQAVGPGDARALSAYIARLEAVPVSRLRRAEQLAFWINLYNALTVRVVLDHLPVDSILEIGISPGWFSIGPWGKKLASVEGERLSLDDIEHRILRPIWRDPRIHYAVSCASAGCPNLALVPYTAGAADAMLTEGSRAYVNHPRGVRITPDGVVVSSIYHWYKADFGGTDAGVLAHLKKYVAPGLRKKLEEADGIYDHAYAWSLNLSPGRPASPRPKAPPGGAN